MKKINKKKLMSGNEAIAEAGISAGCRFYAGYPITPQNELIAYMAKNMVKRGGIFIQAESEIAAINMVLGAAAAGVRAMTSSSGPGISLKQEGISYLAGCELPALIVNVMRAGPGLGDISSSQSDYFQATRGGGHGDYFTPVLAPWSVEEAVKLVMLGFDIADYYRNPVLILADAIIGQMMEPVGDFNKSQFRKKNESKNWALTGAKGRPPNSIKSLYLQEGVLEQHNKQLKKKWDKIRKNEQRFFVSDTADADYLIVAYGSQARISLEAIKMLRKNNIKVGLFRPISLWPFPGKGLRKIAEKVKKVFVVEQSLGQMVEDVQLSLQNKKVYFLGRAGGGVPSVGEITKFINNKLI